jgi:hypothetical protein
MKQILETVEKQQTASEFLEAKGLDSKLYFTAEKRGQEYVLLKPNEVVKTGAEIRAIPKVAGG